MEDSYTVHRRRKAAARRREKTPDPVSRGATSRMDITDDEDEERRARMERMAEEAEKMEQQQKEKRLSQQQQIEADSTKELENMDRKREEPELPVREKRKERISARSSSNMDDMIAIRTEVAAKSAAGNSLKTREAVTADDNNTRPIKQVTGETTSKSDDGTAREEIVVKTNVLRIPRQTTVQDTSETPKDTNDESGRPEVRKIEKRFKRKSRERVERYSRSTDSSEVDEKNESSRKRTKSPEDIRPRVKRTSGRSRIGDPETQKRDAERLNREKRSSSRQKLEDEPCVKDNFEKSRSRPYTQTEGTDEESRAMRKSETFPQKSIEERTIKRSSTELKKQIIPLSNESLIEDFARAQREYMLRERNILDPEPDDIFQDAIETNHLRRRKFSAAQTENESEKVVQTVAQFSDTTDDKRKSWFSRLFIWRGKKQVNDAAEKKIEDDLNLPLSKVESKLIKAEKRQASDKVTLWDFFKAFKDIVGEFKAFVAQNPRETKIIRQLRNRCIAGLLLIIIYCGLGAFVFRFVEGAFETFYKCGVKRVKRDFLDSLWNYSHNLREDDWKSMARRKLMEFEEQLHIAHEAGLHSYSGQKSWSFLNAVAYCLTVITTIGENNVSRNVQI